jgi:parallel beta-helix repeat protein
MTVSRRDLILAGFGFGVAFAASARFAHAYVASNFGVMSTGGTADQTALLQAAIDVASTSRRPLFLPPGIYSTRRLELRSGAHLIGVPGRSILRYRGGGALIGIEQAADIHIEGLVLAGDGSDIGVDGALLAATTADGLQISNCRFLRSSARGILVARSENVSITNNTVDTAATGIAVLDGMNGSGPAVIAGNIVRNLFFRKLAPSHGNAIVVGADARVENNSVANVAGFGILIESAPDVRIAGNRIRNAHIGIGIPSEIAGAASILGNSVSGAKDGAIRAMRGPTPIGPDLHLSATG